MKNKLRSVLLACLSCIVFFTCFYGCRNEKQKVSSGSQDSSISNNSTGENSQSEFPSATDSTSSQTQGGSSTGTKSTAKSNGKLDLKGKKVVYAGTGMPTNYYPEDSKSEEYKAAMKWKSKIEKKYNCKIEYNIITPWDVYYDQFTTMTMAGEKIGDVVVFDNWIYPKVMLNNMLHPLQSYMNVKDYKFWDKNVEPFYTLKNKIYAVSPVDSSIPTGLKNVPCALMYYNKTLFKKYNLDTKYNIDELVDKKQWTWDIFRQILKDSTISTTGDSKPEIWGLGSTGQQFGRLVTYFAESNGAKHLKKTGSKIEVLIDRPEFMKAYEYIYNLTYTDKVISADEKWLGYDTFSMFARGECMFFNSIHWHIKNLKSMVPRNTVIGVLPIPIGPNAGGNYINFQDTACAYGIPSTCKNPNEIAVIFEDWIKNGPKDTRTVRDIWSDYVFDTRSLDVLTMLNKIPKTFDFYYGYQSLNDFIINHHGIPERVPPKTFIDQRKDTIMQEINMVWGSVD